MGTKPKKAKTSSSSAITRVEYSGFAAAILFMGLFVAVGITALIVQSSNSDPDAEIRVPQRMQSAEAPGDSTQASTAGSVFFCTFDGRAMRYDILTAETNKIGDTCDTVSSEGNGRQDHTFFPDGSSYVRVTADEAVVTGDLSGDEESRVFEASFGKLRVLGAAGDSAVIVYEYSEPIATDEGGYPPFDEKFFIVNTDGVARQIFEGTGGHFSSFTYIGYDEKSQQIIGCRATADGCSQLLVIDDDGTVTSEDSYISNSPVVDSTRDQVIYIERGGGRLQAFSYDGYSTEILANLPGYVRVMTIDEAKGLLYFGVEGETNEERSGEVLWSYDISSGELAQVIDKNPEVSSITVRDISVDGRYLLLWVGYYGEANTTTQFELFDTTTNTLVPIVSEQVITNSFRFAYE